MAAPSIVRSPGIHPKLFNVAHDQLNKGLLAALAADFTNGIVVPADIATGVLALPVVPDEEASELFTLVTEQALSLVGVKAELDTLVPRALGFAHDAGLFPPWSARRFLAAPAANIARGLVCIAQDHPDIVNACFVSLGLLGSRAVLALLAENCFSAVDFALPAAATNRAAFNVECVEVLQGLTGAGLVGGGPAVAADAPAPEPVAAAPAAANEALPVALQVLTATVLSLVGQRGVGGARYAKSFCVANLKTCIALHASEMQLTACFVPLPVRTTAEIYQAAGLPAPALVAPQQARNDALPLGHPVVVGALGGGLDAAANAAALMDRLPPALVGGHGGFGQLLPHAGASAPLMPPTLSPPPGVALPSRFIAIGGWWCPADFLVDPTDPLSVMRDKAREMVMTSTGGYIPRINITSPTPLKDSVELLFGGMRGGDWMLGTGQWVHAQVTEHMHFLHKCVKLVQQGHAWATVRDIEMEYRRGMFTGKYSSWDCAYSLTSLIVLSAPATKPRAARDNSDPPPTKRTKAGGGVKFKHDQDSSGTDICRNWNNGTACRALGTGGACKLSHVCAVCLKKHKACDMH